MTVTVAVPYYGCPDLVGRAVRSILDQTYRDIHVVVIGDGEEPPLEGITDSRLDVFTMPVNRGAYFALQVALLGVGHRWFAPFGADDYADPDHLERLVALYRSSKVDAVITGAVFNNAGQVHTGPYEVGLFRRRRMLRIGGYNPAERVGQDTLMLRLLKLTGPVVATNHPTYHRVRRPDSLTTAPDTALGSPYRNAVKSRNRSVFASCEGLREIGLIRAYRQSIVPPDIAAALEEQVAALGRHLQARVAA